MKVNTAIASTIERLSMDGISQERKEVLQQLTAYIQQKIDTKAQVNLNFICTHNSRRSHLSQIWGKTMAAYFQIENVVAYSGGTEATAVFPSVIEALQKSGFEIQQLSEGNNPVYAIKYEVNNEAIIGFSKRFDDHFNPKSSFAAIMTCTQADEGCPFVSGSDARIALPFEDPKAYDGTPQQAEKYLERSLQIATELKYVFQQLKA